MGGNFGRWKYATNPTDSHQKYCQVAGNKMIQWQPIENEKSSNKLRMKALVGWNILFQVPKLIYAIVFFTRIKNDLDKEDKIAWDLN